ncbi:unnamed protein product [Caenorhabditis nigoni]
MTHQHYFNMDILPEEPPHPPPPNPTNMAKRPSTDSVAQIIDKAKRMAATFQMKEFTDKAARELKKPIRQMKCKKSTTLRSVPPSLKMKNWPRRSKRTCASRVSTLPFTNR